MRRITLKNLWRFTTNYSGFESKSPNYAPLLLNLHFFCWLFGLFISSYIVNNVQTYIVNKQNINNIVPLETNVVLYFLHVIIIELNCPSIWRIVQNLHLSAQKGNLKKMPIAVSQFRAWFSAKNGNESSKWNGNVTSLNIIWKYNE